MNGSDKFVYFFLHKILFSLHSSFFFFFALIIVVETNISSMFSLTVYYTKYYVSFQETKV